MRWLSCAFAFFLCQATAFAAPPLINAETVCPMSGPNRACLLAQIIPFEPSHNDHNVGDLNTPYRDPTVFNIRGRLNGGKPRHFQLQISRNTGDRMTPPYPPDLAYLGQSQAGNSIILTTEGMLEILSPRFRARTRSDFIDERTWKFLNIRIIATSSGSVTFPSTTEPVIWDSERRLCIAGTMPKRERLRAIPDGCRMHPNFRPPLNVREARAKLISEALQLPGWLLQRVRALRAAHETGLTVDQILELNSPPSSAAEEENTYSEPAVMSLARLKELFPDQVNEEMEVSGSVSDHYGGAGTGIDIYRIKGTHVLFVSIVHDDC